VRPAVVPCCANGRSPQWRNGRETLYEPHSLGFSCFASAEWRRGTGMDLVQFTEPATPHMMAVAQLRRRKRTLQALWSLLL